MGALLRGWSGNGVGGGGGIRVNGGVMGWGGVGLYGGCEVVVLGGGA